MKRLFPPAVFAIVAIPFFVAGQDTPPVPPDLRHWLKAEQRWIRDTDGPIVELGDEGEFDDTHLFAPTVAWRGKDRPEKFRLWYPGSRGSVKDRVFQLGLALSNDGREFTKLYHNPVFRFGDAKNRQSVLTPCLLRDALGRPQKIDDRFVLYFSATDFHDPSGRHTLHRTTSENGIHWNDPSPALLENCYAPTLLKIGRLWQLWYTDVSGSPWIFRKAESTDGLKWRVHPEPVMGLDQEWEKTNLFYPHVIKPSAESPYLMWYGSYLAHDQHRTALGFAVSLDGIRWHKHPKNPIFTADPTRPWESHYVTSHSVAVLPNEEGTHDFRIWYASRKAPPFLNKYFALNTAIWEGPVPFNRPPRPTAQFASNVSVPERFVRPFNGDRSQISKWRMSTRRQLSTMLGIPGERAPLAPEKRGELTRDGIVIEKWIFTVSGWAFDDIALRTKFCTSVPTRRMRESLTWPEFFRLMSRKHIFIMNGDADWVIDREDEGSAWDGMRRHLLELPHAPGEIRLWFEKGGGHRPYFLHPEALFLLRRDGSELGVTRFSPPQSVTSGGTYCDAHGIRLEKLYGTRLHQRGATLVKPDPPIRPLTREQLAVLKPGEVGRPEFTLEGWLEMIEARR